LPDRVPSARSPGARSNHLLDWDKIKSSQCRPCHERTVVRDHVCSGRPGHPSKFSRSSDWARHAGQIVGLAKATKRPCNQLANHWFLLISREVRLPGDANICADMIPDECRGATYVFRLSTVCRARRKGPASCRTSSVSAHSIHARMQAGASRSAPHRAPLWRWYLSWGRGHRPNPPQSSPRPILKQRICSYLWSR